MSIGRFEVLKYGPSDNQRVEVAVNQLPSNMIACGKPSLLGQSASHQFTHPHAKPHTSHLTPYTLHLTPHTSHLTPHSLMSIQFACPKCNNRMTVDDKLAGKSGKCPKCGTSVQVPVTGAASEHAAPPRAPKTKSAATVSPGMLHALDDLTDSDFNRQSPFEKVYAPPKVASVSHDLIKRVAEKDGRPVVQVRSLPIVARLIGLMNLVFAILFGYAVLVFSDPSTFARKPRDRWPEQLKALFDENSTSHMVSWAVAAAIALLMAIGIYSKKKWGYALSTTLYVCSCGFLALLTVLVARDLLGFGLIGGSLLIGLACTSYFFTEGCRKFYKIHKWNLPILCAASGAVLAIVLIGVQYLVRSLTSTSS